MHTNENNLPVRRKGEQGFTLIEVMIALVIFAIGILGVAIMQLNAINGNASARMSTETVTLAQDQIERLLGLPYDHADLTDGTHPDVTLAGGVYQARWEVTDDSPVLNCKTVVMTVTKIQATLGRFKEVEIQFVKPQVF
jgi:type IV pilus assembly protein PilV